MKNKNFGFMLRALLPLCILFSSMMLTSCSDMAKDDNPKPTSNPIRWVNDPAKLEMLYSLVDLEENKGRLYEMTYTVDYKLDEALNAGIVGQMSLMQFAMTQLLDKNPIDSKGLSFDAGCSAFACQDPESKDFIMGRNFDFTHRDKNGDRVMIPVIVVHTAPAGGKKSVSFVDGQFINYKSGFYTDGTSDLSMLMALPYLLLDGINEDGFAISVLKLDGNPTRQHYSDRKNNIFTTVAMRMLLDRASTVSEATKMLEEYNMCMDNDKASYHFFMADATGDYAIVEYTFKEGEEYPTEMEVLKGDDAWRYVTNFYASPSMVDSPDGSVLSTHGKSRYNTLKENLSNSKYKLNPVQAMELLQKVAQGPDEEATRSTGFTQWSEVYNLNKKTVKMSILREFDKTFTFSVE